MKHAVSTYKTKKLLSESLKSFMEKKDFSKITVSEITAACNLNRKTFYYHFQDLNQLLKWTLEQEAMGTIKEYSQMKNYKDAIAFTIDYVKKNRRLFNYAYKSIGRSQLIFFFGNDFKEILNNAILQNEKKLNITISESFKSFLCSFYSEALTGQIAYLLENDQKYDKDQLVSYVSLTLSSSLSNVMEAYVKSIQYKSSDSPIQIV